MGQKHFRPILDKLNTTSSDIFASVLMTGDGVALVSASPEDRPYCDEDKISALAASIMHLGHRLMGDFVGGGLDQLLIKGEGGYVLVIPSQDFALTALVNPDAEVGPIFSQMKQAMESLRQLSCGLAKESQ